MPADSSPRSRWSLKSMLGRKGSSTSGSTPASGSSSGSGSKKKSKRCTCKSQEEQECSVTSIKERVLAKLKEPLPSEVRQAARHSLDSSLSSMSLAPTLTRASHPTPVVTASSHGHHRRRALRGVAAAAEDEILVQSSQRLGQGSSRFSSSSSNWGSESDMIDSSQASAKECYRGGYYPSHRVRSQSRSSCSSPTSNVIAKLMGLGDASYIHPTLFSQKQASSRPSPRLSFEQSRVDGCSPAQDFLDEMEDHLRQCDKALERIEAVMQLKKKLLYLSNKTASRSCELDYRRMEEHHGPNNRKHVRTGSMDQAFIQRREREYEAAQAHQQQQQQQQGRYRHRRSFSDGETPVFRLAQDMESFRERHAAEPESMKHLIRKVATQSLSPGPRTPLPVHFSHLEEHRVPTPPSDTGNNSEQPSPVSVLDSHLPDDSTSEDDPADSRASVKQTQAQPQPLPPAAALDPAKPKKKRSVVRALWSATTPEELPAPPAPVSTKQTIPSSNDAAIDDLQQRRDVVARVERGWALGWKAEVGEVATEVEKLIFRRLLEETMIHVASCCRR